MVKRNVVGIQTASAEKKGFLLTDAALAILARDYAASVERSGRLRGTYLSVLVAHSKRELKARRATAEQAIEAVERVNEHFYPIILEAVITPEIAITDDLSEEEKLKRSKERTRRATFARTAKSTLVSAIKHGARLSAMDPAKVTKASLQEYYAQAREGPDAVEERIQRTEGRLEDLLSQLPVEERVQRTEARLEALVKDLAEEDPAVAQRFVEELQERLESVLEESKPEVPVRQMKGRRRVGELTLHPH